jgi:hypothetical protein
MIDSERINRMLHARSVPAQYFAQVGERLVVDLPHLPFNRFTEYVEIRPETEGDVDAFSIQPEASQGEGRTSPHGLHVKPLRAGQVHIVLKPRDVRTGRIIDGVMPIDIMVQARDSE